MGCSGSRCRGYFYPAEFRENERVDCCGLLSLHFCICVCIASGLAVNIEYNSREKSLDI